jgi:hypothetical protein
MAVETNTGRLSASGIKTGPTLSYIEWIGRELTALRIELEQPKRDTAAGPAVV